MCLMCVEIAKGRMRIYEARTALKELILTASDPKELEHYEELSSLTDEELEKKAMEFKS